MIHSAPAPSPRDLPYKVETWCLISSPLARTGCALSVCMTVPVLTIHDTGVVVELPYASWIVRVPITFDGQVLGSVSLPFSTAILRNPLRPWLSRLLTCASLDPPQLDPMMHPEP